MPDRWVTHFLVWTAGAMIAASASQNPETALTARQLFFTKKATPTPKKATSVKPTDPGLPPPETARVPATPETVSERMTEERRNEEASAPQPAKYFGIRYSLLQLGSDDRETEVDPDKVFHAGDRIRLRLVANQSGFLYIVQQGSSGNWEVLLPKVSQPAQAVEGMRPVKIPEQDCFEFDQTPGTERLFMVLAKVPEESLEALIGSVRSQRSSPSVRPTEGPTQLALNRPVLSGVQMDGLRSQLTARDLRVQKVKQGDRTEERENAVYIVNASAENSRVIFDVSLQHR